jgi:HK97 family phage prohead protease
MDKNEKIERRVVSLSLRAGGTDDKPVIAGDAAVFNQETVIGSWFREMIKPGAFKRVLGEKPDVVAAFNHDWSQILGRTTAGTLRLEETDEALRYEADINLNDPQAVSIYEKVKRGDVSQASFAFTVRKEEWINPPEKNGMGLRIITEIDELYDVGPCTFGAYPQASAQARSKASEFQQDATPANGQETEAVNGEQEDPQEQVEALRRRLAIAG